MSSAPVVSSESEELIRVDAQDNVVGFASKGICHDGEGLLHRAFSVFLFDKDGRVLLQQRSEHKRLWPLFWSNSCCSHPRRGEEVPQAAQRRVLEELGVRSDLHFVYKFQYEAQFADAGSENELCSVFVGGCESEIVVNDNEIAAWRFVEVEELTQQMRDKPDEFTPWLKMEWAQLFGEHRQSVEKALSAT